MPRSLRLPSGPQRLALASGHEPDLLMPLFEGGEAVQRPRANVVESVRDVLDRSARVLTGADEEQAARQSWAPVAPDWAEGGEQTRHGYTIVENVALISIEGPLFARGYYSAWSERYFPGYRDYVAAMQAASEDDRVDAIMPLYDTPGGYVAGQIDAVNAFRALRQANGGPKPVVSHVSSLCCSAGQWLFSQSDACFASEAAIIGSIGVRIMFFDMSGWLAKMGDTAHSWTSGRLKEMGSPFRPPTDEESALFQTEVAHLASRFYEGVALGRGLDIEAVRESRGWEARTFTAGDPPPPAELDPLAVDLIDGVMTEEAAFAIAQQLAGTPAAANPPNPVSVSAAASRAASCDEAEQGRSVPAAGQMETPMSLKAKMAALAAKASNGDPDAQVELNEICALIAASAESEDESEAADGEDEDSANAADGTDDDAEAENGDDDDAANAEGEDEDAADAEDGEDDDAEARADQILSAPEAKGREALAGKLAVKVAGGKLTPAEALDMLKASPKAASAFRKSAGAFTPLGVKGGSGRARPSGDQAQASLGASLKRISRQ
ncbi:S49 family peptidase [Oceanicaulis alexandrii]|uniref:S49 family peptidase n=1 Tax=Oceanicaulis alexandrii TaxID=153233 RepID=UPI0035D00397